MAGLCSPAVLQPLPNIDPCLLSFKYNLDVSKGTLASSGGMRTCDFLDPSEDPSVGDPDVDGGGQPAVDAGRHDEVLLVVRFPGRTFKNPDCGGSGVSFTSVLNLVAGFFVSLLFYFL